MSYTVTISVLGPLTGGACRPPTEANFNCQKQAFYSVSATQSATGTSGGSNVCAQHLFATIGYFLGLPEPDAPRSAT